MHSEDKQRLIDDIELKLHQKPQAAALEQQQNRINSHGNYIIDNGMTPTNEYEQLRRRVRSNTHEMWNYMNSELAKIWKKAKPYVPELGQYIDSVMEVAAEHKRSLVNDIDRLEKIDGYSHWRSTEAENLSGLVQRRLTYLQNPEDCSKARKLVCRLNKVCVI